jgi:hypothetical protein
MQRIIALGFSMYCLHILNMSSFVSRAISVVTVEITPGKSTKTIRGRDGPKTNGESDSKIHIQKPTFDCEGNLLFGDRLSTLYGISHSEFDFRSKLGQVVLPCQIKLTITVPKLSNMIWSFTERHLNM